MTERKKLSKKIRLRLEVCSTCMKMCRDVCPTALATSSESFTPYMRTLFVNLDQKGIRALDSDALDIIFSCLTCNLCNSYCLPKVSVEELMKISRAYIVSSGLDVSKYSKISDRIAQFFNPLGEDPDKRFDKFNNIINNTENSENLLFIGCMASYRESEIAISTIELLNKLNIDFITMKNERCCGSPAISTGFIDTAIKTIQLNVQDWRNSGIKNVITPCSACYRTIKTEYPKYVENFDFNVFHIIEILEKHLDGLKLHKFNLSTTFHDPCHLGRAMEIYDSPRNILNKIPEIKYIEMDRSREKSFCCGAGGGVRVNFPDLADSIVSLRLKEVNDHNIECLVSACPLCKYHFKNSKNIGKIKVMDITELINSLI